MSTHAEEQLRGRPNHLAIWGISAVVAAIAVLVAMRTSSSLESIGFPKESMELLRDHRAAIFAFEGVLLTLVLGGFLYWRGAFRTRIAVVPSDHRDESGVAYVPLAWVDRGRIVFGDAFLADDGLHLVAYGEDSPSEAAAAKMAAMTRSPMFGGELLRAALDARREKMERGRASTRGQSLQARVQSNGSSRSLPRGEVKTLTYGRFFGSAIVTDHGKIHVHDLAPEDAARLQRWIDSGV